MTRAFSLVELSIVLVILGLLTGGILAGQSLIRAAELRSIPTDVNRFNSATLAFRDKYFTLPGDMRNATRFWGAQAGATTDGTTAACLALDYTTPATGAATCNGDGNGQVGWKEGWRGWQQLANAGLVEGSFTGVPGVVGDDTFGTAGENMPRSRANDNIGFAAVYSGPVTVAGGAMFIGNFGHTLRLGMGNGTDEGNVPSSEDAWNIDTKMDDGRPGTGSVRSYTNTSRPTCATTDVTSTAQYTLTSLNGSCNLVFILLP